MKIALVFAWRGFAGPWRFKKTTGSTLYYGAAVANQRAGLPTFVRSGALKNRTRGLAHKLVFEDGVFKEVAAFFGGVGCFSISRAFAREIYCHEKKLSEIGF
ncbi:MAG: hypothetical protein EOM55_05325 [Clostridia bacterium]|nr:hypothetical protein [Clostridia bacterium]